MTSLRRAIAAWASQPARARRDAIAFFKDEAAQSHNWSLDTLNGPAEVRRHKRDAAALDAAVKLLRAAGKRSKKR